MTPPSSTRRARTLQLLAMVAGLSLILAACGPGDDAVAPDPGTVDDPAEPDEPEDTDEPVDEPADEPDPDRPSTLVWDQSFHHLSHDPSREGTAAARPLMRASYETLVHFTTPDVSEVEPLLAESWDISDDATVFTFNLRQDVVFSDGTPMTSADVLFTFNRFVHMQGPFAWLLEGTSFEAPDDHTFVIRSDEPNIGLPFIITYPKLGVLNSELVRANGGTDAPDAAETDQAEQFLNEQSAGTGPYVLTHFTTDDRVEYMRNDNYWGDPAPFDRIVTRNTEKETAALHLQSGDSHISAQLTFDELPALDTTNLQVVTEVGPVVWYFFLNRNPEVSEVTSNPDFREAVRFALDYDRLLELGGPEARQACGLVPSMVLGALPDGECISQDLDRARAALERSGIDNPSFTMEYLTDSPIDGLAWSPFIERIQLQLSQVGIEVNLSGQPIATGLDRYRTGEADSFFWTISMRHPDASSYVQALSPPGGNITPAGVQEGDWPELDEVSRQILTATSDEEREGLIHDFQHLLNEDGAFIPFMQSTRTMVAADWLRGQGLSPHPLYLVDLRGLE